MNKVYLVVEYGGTNIDYWEEVIGVCSTAELAESLRSISISNHNLDTAPIDEITWTDISDKYWDTYPDEEILDPEKMHKLFPEYSISDLNKANIYYDGYCDWEDTRVDEVKLITEEKQLWK